MRKCKYEVVIELPGDFSNSKLNEYVASAQGKVIDIKQILLPFEFEVGDEVIGSEIPELPKNSVVIADNGRPRVVTHAKKLVGQDGHPFVPPHQGRYKIVYLPPKD